jgi:hypothetical protein
MAELIVSNYSRIHYHMLDPSYFRIQKLGALVSNMISYAYCTLGVSLYCELMT